MAQQKTIEQICAELEAGEYCGQVGDDNQWQLDILTVLKGVFEGGAEPVQVEPVQIEALVVRLDGDLGGGDPDANPVAATPFFGLQWRRSWKHLYDRFPVQVIFSCMAQGR